MKFTIQPYLEDDKTKEGGAFEIELDAMPSIDDKIEIRRVPDNRENLEEKFKGTETFKVTRVEWHCVLEQNGSSKGNQTILVCKMLDDNGKSSQYHQDNMDRAKRAGR